MKDIDFFHQDELHGVEMNDISSPLIVIHGELDQSNLVALHQDELHGEIG